MIITRFNTRGVFDMHNDPHTYAGVGMRPVHLLTPSLQCAWRVLLYFKVNKEGRGRSKRTQQATRGGVNSISARANEHEER